MGEAVAVGTGVPRVHPASAASRTQHIPMMMRRACMPGGYTPRHGASTFARSFVLLMVADEGPPPPSLLLCITHPGGRCGPQCHSTRDRGHHASRFPLYRPRRV